MYFQLVFLDFQIQRKLAEVSLLQTPKLMETENRWPHISGAMFVDIPVNNIYEGAVSNPPV